MIKELDIKNYLPHIGRTRVHDEIMTGLMAPQKYIPSKYFYDTRGSELFEEITSLDEYYPTRTEKQILSNLFNILKINLRHMSIVELGSGDPSKITLLLQQQPDRVLRTINYYPVDICESEIIKSVEALSEQFPLHTINGIVADFQQQLHVLPKDGQRLFCFFGSTIGNFTMEEAERFIRQLEKEMQPGDRFLLGVDMVKDTDVVERAYNDSQGVTAQFNLNMLNVVNGLLGTDFRAHDFEHLAFFNKEKSCIEMHLRALKDIIVMPRDSSDFITLKKNETIRTENSHKFTYDKIKQLCQWGGFSQYTICHDPQGWFSVVYAVK